MIETTQQFASGGWGPNEEFVEPHKGKLGESLTGTHNHFETPCGSYAHLKLARYLLRFTGEARYGDGLERVLYNTVLGVLPPSGDGHFFYYSDYHPTTQKRYYGEKWPCCSGTLPQVVADYAISAYFRSADGIYVNLFVPSEVSWKIDGQPVRLIQTTKYPEAESTELRMELAAPAEFTISLRIPGWLQSPAQITVNGKDASVAAEPRTFATIRRVWRNNDTVQLTLPFSLRQEPIDGHRPNTVGPAAGPFDDGRSRSPVEDRCEPAQDFRIIRCGFACRADTSIESGSRSPEIRAILRAWRTELYDVFRIGLTSIRYRKPDHPSYRGLGGNCDTHRHMVRHPVCHRPADLPATAARLGFLPKPGGAL